jgi:hypothetical protein
MYKIVLKVKRNMETSSQRLKSDSYQTHQHKTDRVIPEPGQKQIAPDTTTVASFEFPATRTPLSELNLFLFRRHRTNSALEQLSVTDSDYYITSKYPGVCLEHLRKTNKPG